MAPFDLANFFTSLSFTISLLPYYPSSVRSVLFPTIAKITSFGDEFTTYSAQFCRVTKEQGSPISQTSKAIFASRQYILAMDLYFSCPVVSQICILQLFPGENSNVRSMNEAPRVVGDRGLNQLLRNLVLMLVFPTPEAPTITTFSFVGSRLIVLLIEVLDFYIYNRLWPPLASKLRNYRTIKLQFPEIIISIRPKELLDNRVVAKVSTFIMYFQTNSMLIILKIMCNYI